MTGRTSTQLAAIIALALSTAPVHGWKYKELELVFVAVGHGDSTIVKCPNGNIAVVDMGSTHKPDLALTNMATALNQTFEQVERAFPGRQPRTIDLLVLTHPHADHYNLVRRVLDGHNTKPIQLERVAYVDRHRDAYKNRLIDMLKGRGATLNRISRQGTSTFLSDPDRNQLAFDCGEAKFFVVAADAKGDVNTGSIVIKVSYRKKSALLMADATPRTARLVVARIREHSMSTPVGPSARKRRRMSESYYAVANDLRMHLRSDVLRLAHHGSVTAATTHRGFKDIIEAKYEVISAGVDPRHHLPRCRNRDMKIVIVPETLSGHLIRCWVPGSGRKGDWSNVMTRDAIVSTTLPDGSLQSFVWNVPMDSDADLGAPLPLAGQ